MKMIDFDAQKAHRPQKSVRFCALFLLESTEKGCIRGGGVVQYSCKYKSNKCGFKTFVHQKVSSFGL